MAANGRYGGHFVTGHIDATGVVREWKQVGRDYELRVGIEPAQGAYLVPKGCIAVDGISLTVAEVGRPASWLLQQIRAMDQSGDHSETISDIASYAHALSDPQAKKNLPIFSEGFLRKQKIIDPLGEAYSGFGPDEEGKLRAALNERVLGGVDWRPANAVGPNAGGQGQESPVFKEF